MAVDQKTTRRSTSAVSPILVLGIGNILLGDEGVGVHVVQAMERIDLPNGVQVFDGATAGLDLLDVLADRHKVIVVDAMNSQCDAGTVMRLRPEDLEPSKSATVSLHDVGIMETISMAEQLGVAPDEVVILGVQPKTLECGLELSPEVSKQVPEIIKAILAEVGSGESVSPPEVREDRSVEVHGHEK